MATLISAHQITKSFASKTLFSKISFAIDSEERIGLIGPNGAGKSTLLSIISRKQVPDSGQVTFANKLRLGYLEQSPQLAPGLSVYETLIEASDDPFDSANIQNAVELISKLNIDSLDGGSEKKIGTLSGGWQKKVALARELMRRPNLLLLDEPTNHLDLESILWLEEFLQRSRELAVLIVTHDRRFLQNTCNVIFDLNPQLPAGLLRTAGNYAAHIESKMMLLEGQKRLEEKRRNTMLREKEWLARGPQARLTKQKARIDRAHELIDEVGQLENKNAKRSLDLDFGQQMKSPKRLIEADHISKRFDSRVLFHDFSAIIRPGHRYGLIGANGAGKSTLLKCLIGQLQVDSGSVFVNEDINISYFEQGKENVDPNRTVLKYICPEGDYVHFQGQAVFARSYLNRFLFNNQQMDMPARQLSGGELSRLILAKLMLQTAHVLILDEPTNDLDVETLEALAECISEYKGAVILVSHDRFFMDQNCDVIWAIDERDGKVTVFADTQQWEEWYRLSRKNAKADSLSGNVAKKSSSGKVGLSYKEKLEFEKIEARISEEENKLQNLNEQLQDSETTSDFAKLSALTDTIAATEKNIESLFARWEYLTEKNKES